MWAIKMCFVRRVGGLMLVEIVSHSFILYSIDVTAMFMLLSSLKWVKG